MTYKVKYKTRGSWFWKTLKNVKGDTVCFLENELKQVMGVPLYIFTLNNDEVVRVPMDGTEVIFSKERELIVLKKIKKKTGQDVTLNKD